MFDTLYKVVDITSEYDVVINAGYEDDNVTDGTKFEIFAYGKEILDPDTKESLGTLDIIKQTVEAVNVYPRMCRCRNIEIVKKTIPSILSSIALYEKETEVPTAQKLNIDYTDIQPNIDVDRKIKVGDLARIKQY